MKTNIFTIALHIKPGWKRRLWQDYKTWLGIGPELDTIDRAAGAVLHLLRLRND